jgi:hypothetical protein
MEALFRTGEEIGSGEWGVGSGEWGVGSGDRKNTPFPIPHSLFPIYFALTGNSRSKTNSIMISVRATAEVFAAK